MRGVINQMSSVWNLKKFKRCNVGWYFFRRQGSKFPWKLSTWCPRASYLPPSLHGCCRSSWAVSVCSSSRSVYGSRAQGKCEFCTCDIQISGGLFFLVTMALLSRERNSTKTRAVYSSRVRTCHRKPGKSWNSLKKFIFNFLSLKVMEN